MLLRCENSFAWRTADQHYKDSNDNSQARQRKSMATIGYLTTTLFDFGAIKSLKNEVEALGIRRPLLVTDPGVEAVGIAAKVLAQLEEWL